MQSRTWLFLLLSLMQTPDCIAKERCNDTVENFVHGKAQRIRGIDFADF